MYILKYFHHSKKFHFRDEGIILKDMGSKWEPSDRSGKWLKLKPDYVNPGSDLDVLIIGSFFVFIWFHLSQLRLFLYILSSMYMEIGGYYGSGRHGGEVCFS